MSPWLLHWGEPYLVVHQLHHVLVPNLPDVFGSQEDPVCVCYVVMRHSILLASTAAASIGWRAEGIFSIFHRRIGVQFILESCTGIERMRNWVLREGILIIVAQLRESQLVGFLCLVGTGLTRVFFVKTTCNIIALVQLFFLVDTIFCFSELAIELS